MSKTVHALIVGINAYTNRPLYGCVNDALAVGRFLKEFCDNPDNGHQWNPQYLLAPHSDGADIVKQAELVDKNLVKRQLPLRANLIKAFDHFMTSSVKPDDVCVIYYSGHGSLEVAAPEFIGLEPDGMNGTYVCLDSRDKGNRDLLDKEFAWLIAKVKSRVPQGHLLVITDSCHSGGATRSSDNTTRDRREGASDTPTPFLEILGVANVPESERILALTDNKAYYKSEAKHIHLAAARDSETAKETAINGQQHGIFTWNLLKVLSSGGTALSYRELMRRTEVMVRSMVSNQMPRIDAFAKANQSEAFLGGALSSAAMEYPVVYLNKQWQLKAGALNGIVVEATKQQPTTVRLTDGREIAVTEVFSNYSVLDSGKFTPTDASMLLFNQRAVIQKMPNSRISIFIQKETVKGALLDGLQTATFGNKIQYCDFWATSEAAADYSVMMDEANNYMLVRKGSNYPVFKRQVRAFDFVTFCNNVGKWRFVQEMGKPAMNGFTMDDIEITLEVLSGIDEATINSAKGQVLLPEEDVVLLYTPPTDSNPPSVPALRCTVKIKKPTFWVGGLYLDNEFGVHSLLSPEQDKKGEDHPFSFQTEGASYNAIPLLIDDIRLQQGVREITEYLKIYISNKDFSLSDFEQLPLPLDDQPITRGTGFGKGFGSTPDWMVITIPVTIRAVSEKVALKSISGAGFKVSGLPSGFEANASVASLSEIAAKLNHKQTSRSVEMELQKFVLPPASIWGESMEESVVFSKDFDGEQSQSVSVMELTAVEGKLTSSFYIDLDSPCQEDEVIVAFGYDEDMGSYFPVGISDGNNRVEVMALPSETPGSIHGEEDGFTGRDLKRSVKMFFKKMVRKQNPNVLAMVHKDLSRETDIAKIRAAVAKANRILMVTPGFLGDTDKIAEAIMQKTRIHESYDVVFTFDYECLNTPLQKTAEDLYDRLKDAGVFDPAKGRRLTVLGSSMGGIMCRWMVEKHQDAGAFVSHLVLVAAPNLGTDISVFRKRLFALIGKALAGVAAIKPFLIPLSIFGKKADKVLWVTLEQMNPDTSDFLKQLNSNNTLPPGIKCNMIGGTVKNVGLNRNNKGKFWKRFKKFVFKTFMDWAVFEGEHDLVNPVKSQKGAPWMKPGDMVILNVDHLSYYFEEESLRELEKALMVKPGPVVEPVVIASR